MRENMGHVEYRRDPESLQQGFWTICVCRKMYRSVSDCAGGLNESTQHYAPTHLALETKAKIARWDQTNYNASMAEYIQTDGSPVGVIVGSIYWMCCTDQLNPHELTRPH